MLISHYWRIVFVIRFRFSPDGNQLTGEIPDSIGQAESLIDLYLKGNSLSGSVPVGISQLKQLQVVLLEQNNLAGDMGGKFCDPTYSNKMLNTVNTGNGGESGTIKTLVMDCEEPNLKCDCCTKCCSSSDNVCNTEVDWTNFRFYWKPNWNHGYYDNGLGF